MKNKLIFSTILLTLSLFGCNNVPSNISSHNQSIESSEQSSIASSESKDDKNVDVIILAGQSNAEGHTHSSELKKNVTPTEYAYYESQMKGIKIKYHCDNGKNKSEDFVNVHLGEGFNLSRFGPEIGMAKKFEESNLNREVYIIKYALGASNLYSQWRSTSSGAEGPLYKNLIMYCLENLGLIEEKGLTPHIKGICWMQGEADSMNTTHTAYYEEYERNFFSDINEQLCDYIDDEKLNIFDAYISDYSGWTNYRLINDAKKQNSINNENHHIIDTIGEKLEYNREPSSGVDYYHYDSLSMIRLGEMFAESILENAI